MWLHNPLRKQVRNLIDALEDIPRGVRRFGGPEGLCRAFAALVDHTLLKPGATPDDVRRLCEEGATHRFAAVIVNPCYVALAVKGLAGTGIPVGSVAGFPLGASRPEVKLLEAERVLADGAREVDMVIQVGALKAGNNDLVQGEIRALAKACHRRDALLKTILECAVLSDEEKRRGARLALRGGADFVKTSTGFGPPGATVEDVALLRRAVGRDVGVKASGGIRTLAAAVSMLAAGASRIGTSSGVAILRELRQLAEST